jgi:hypothetical protein
MLEIFNFLSNIISTTFTFIGIATVINKLGNFFKVIEENKSDGFKKGFDAIVLESINDINKCIESISLIASNTNRIIFVIYDITLGNKIIKKNKEGNLVIFNKSKIYSGFKEKINELSSKIKKYKEELNKIKGNEITDKEDDLDDDDCFSDISQIEEEDEESTNQNKEGIIKDNENKEEDKEEEFYLES